jgi:para-nitrobenzyl esterase
MDSSIGRPPFLLTRREMVLACTAALQASVLAQPDKTEYAEVTTPHGRIRGTRSPGLTIFKGIPYAGPVSGPNRFKAAPPLQSWTGVRDGLQVGAPSMQPGQRRNEPAQDENCLFLNIWTPATDGRKRPVMFYSHGGGFTTGSAAAGYQDGSGLARTFDVVVVATNHRLGLFGYLFLGELGGEEYSTSGNQGLLDIRDGLKWVHENIAAFGGDPDNVMIFGESGGGAKTSCLYAMPSAAPFFTKASIESGPGVRMLPRDVAAQTTLMALRELGLAKTEWRRLLEIPADKLLAVQNALGQRGGPLTMTGGRMGIGGGGTPGGFGPVVDGTILPTHPFDPVAPAVSAKKPLIVGYNRDETVFFFQQQRNVEVFTLTESSLKDRLARELGSNADAVFDTYRTSRPDASPSDLYVAITTARMIGIGATTIAERKVAQRGASVYMYIFTHESDALVPGTQRKVGSPHAMEIPYKFYNVQREGGPAGGGMMSVSGPAAEKAAHNMAEMWSTFARTGRPGAQGQPTWPPYTLERRATMEIDSECRIADDPWGMERRLWDRLEPR